MSARQTALVLRRANPRAANSFTLAACSQKFFRSFPPNFPMKLSVSRYVTLITVQTMLLVLDLCINAFADLTLSDTIVALVIFM
jgi:hypothetical protein